jgi:hypothetical protein
MLQLREFDFSHDTSETKSYGRKLNFVIYLCWLLPVLVRAVRLVVLLALSRAVVEIHCR